MARRVALAVAGVMAWVFLVPAAATPAVVPGLVNAPRIGVGPGGGAQPAAAGVTNAGWRSSNWSGYATTGTGFKRITASWVVPTVTSTAGSSFSSTWAGIDGFNNQNLIQTGTEQDFQNGVARYDAWWEILPAAETVIPSITVRPGDHFTASIVKGSGTTWSITLADVTSGRSFTINRAYSGPGTSAEWIQEAPSVNGRVATLAHYGRTAFDPDTLNGASPALNANESGVMVQNGVQVSTPSAPDADTDGFNVAFGATAPPPPAS
jgi:peptidase A4-like protein